MELERESESDGERSHTGIHYEETSAIQDAKATHIKAAHSLLHVQFHTENNLLSIDRFSGN